MIGQLFTQDFLSRGIADTPAWKSVTDAELEGEKAFGHYLSKDLALAYMNAVAAGDLSSVVKV